MSLFRPRPTSARRGVLARLSGLLLGASCAGALIVAIVAPLTQQGATLVVVPLVATHSATPIAWPNHVESALVIPALHVVDDGPHDAVVPIASLTKMMTALVVLERLPLREGETGPCLTINAGDVANEQLLKSTDQSNAGVALGESLCESDLLNGLLVHSASNFADLLANLAYGSPTLFVAHMNAVAHVLGLVHTHYADPSGYDNANVSTALDQARLASILMESSLVRSIVDQRSVTLAVAGTLGSYTPYVGSDGVVGVKSGRTDAAGGCDVMAMTFATSPRQSALVYAVVLGARGGDLLGPAGTDALALATSATANRHTLTLAAGSVVGRFGWPGHTSALVTRRGVTLTYWSQWPQTWPTVAMTSIARRSTLAAMTIVGTLHATTLATPVAVMSATRASAPTWLERLR